MDNICSILVLSCDKNKDLLKYFFDAFDTNWGDCKYDIYVSMERCDHLDIQKCIQILNYDKNNYWSERIKYALKKIPTENVLIILDDFIIEGEVDDSKIKEIILKMKNDPSIANVLLTEITGDSESGERLLSNYVLRSKYSRYRTALQCGLWNRDTLIHLLRNRENAWEFELFSNMRSFKLEKRFYALSNNSMKPIPYNDGFFIVQGKLNSIEKVRLEKKIGKPILLDGYEETGPYIIRDNTSFFKRIIRRLRIIIYYLYYRFISAS